ncbi:MAG: hypothetical protein ABUL60_22915 [Myxococcales bacterium]
MRRYLFGWSVLLPLFLGCSAENIVAGEEKTQAEQLASELPAWCGKVCARLRACPENTGCDCNGDVCDCVGVDDTCEQQCPISFARFTGNEACAAIGQRIKSCLDRVACDKLDGSDPCPATAAERELCPNPNDADVPPDSTGPSAGTTVGPTVQAVTCTDSSAAGGGMPENGGAQVTCEENRGACSDGHVYSWICSQDSEGERACACLVDAQAKASFVPISSDCPALSHVNAGCGWALTR